VCPQRVRVAGRHSGELAVIPEDRAQSGWGQRLPAVRPLGHHKLPRRGRVRALGQQVSLDYPGHLRIQRDPPFLAFAHYPAPPAANVGIADIEPEHLGRRKPL
jgi:hypothetical protein